MRRSLTLSLQSAAAPPGCRGKRPIGSVSCHLHPERSGPSASLLSTSQGSHLELPCGICHSWWSRTSASITLSRALCIRSEPLTGCSAREALGVSKDTSDALRLVRVWLQLGPYKTQSFSHLGFEILYYWVKERHSLKLPLKHSEAT